MRHTACITWRKESGSLRREQGAGSKNRPLPPPVRCMLLTAFCLLFISALLLWPMPVHAREAVKENTPGLTVSIDKEYVPVGGIIELIISYALPEGAESLSPVKVGGLEGLTVLSEESVNGAIRVKLVVDRLGSWETGEISFSYLDKEGNENSLTAAPVSVSVLSNLGERPEEAQLRPIQDIVPSKSPLLKYAPWIAGIILLAFLISAVFYFLNRIRKEKETAQSLEPAHVRARREMEALESLRLFENGDVKGFYFRFSGIIRKYLEGLRNFPAAEYTTEEIAAKISNVEDRKILPVLRHADLVKFADSVPSSARKDEELRTVLSYIDRTGQPVEQDIIDVKAEEVMQ